MTDTSDCESDAGASPSVSSEESVDSSCSNSSSPALKIVCETPSTTTPKKRLINTGGSCTTVNNSSVLSSSVCSTPISTGRRPRRKQICHDTSFSSIVSTPRSSKLSPVSPRGTQSEPNKVLTPTRKRKEAPQSYTSVENDGQSDPKLSPDSKRKRNKRRRTRSERNIRAGKAVTTNIVAPIPIVAEGEEAAVALDAEIDRVLEEKAIKNNLSATNVKSIIRHVITNNMVQKMIMSAMRRKAEATDGNGGGSSDEDGLMEPKMTRAKTKELLGNKQTPLWPIVDSPVKMKKQPVSETQMLIQHDLPEDSSGDEEYVPKETDIVHSDDESSSVASHASDTPSPAVSTRVSTRRSLQAEKSPFSDNLFKTPPPRPTKALKLQEESAISRRTRSKHPLNDTPLEDLERRLVPPDITDDMYDWGDTDNEDYLAFLKDFLFPGQNIMNEMGDDDEADPEYNVMEDDEDLHDREELRRDRAVKVPKKELNELVAELIEEYHVSSGDDLEDFTSLTSLTPFMMNDSGIYSDDRGVSGERSGAVVLLNNNVIPPSPASSSVTLNPNVSICSLDSVDVGNGVVLKTTPSGPLPTISNNPAEVASSSSSTDPPPVQPGIATFDIVTEAPAPPPPEPLFRELDLQFLQHQMRQHIQLLAQSFVLTVSSEDEGLKKIAKTSKAMVIELKNFATYNGKNSSFAVINLDHAWGLVNGWPHKFLQQSPIKKKILEEKYINESGTEEGSSKVSHFPRHIVKIIAENETFIYKNLLPESFNQKNLEARCKFTFSEDALLVSSLEEMKSMKRSATQMAEIISELLLVVHSQHQVYHRIRNLRKSSSTVCHPDIKKYFTEGILPEPDRNIIQVTELVPLLQRDREGLSSHWATLLDHIEDSSSYRWEEKLNKDPILKSVSLKWVKYSKNKSRKSGQSSDEAPPSPLEVIDQVFPKGVSLIEKPDPDMQAIPLLNASGKPGAIILIPKYAMLPPQPSTLANNSTVDREENKAATNNSSSECTQQTSSANVCVVGLNHLIRKSRETPRKTFTDKKILPDLPEPTANVQVRCVGKPFELPGLGSSTSDSSSQVINLATLQTPLKREVFLKVAEQSETMHHGGVDVVHNVWSYEPPSPNVIYEGTESELSSDQDSFEGEPSEPPPVVTLSSDSEESMGSPMDAGGDGKGSNSPKKSDSGSCTNKQGNTSTNNSSSNNVTTAVSARRPSGRAGGNKGDDSDDDHDKRPHRKRSLPKDCTNDRSSKEKDEDQSPEKEKPVSQNHSKRQSSSSSCVNINATSSQMQPPPSKPIASTSQYHTSRSQPKKTRKSPGNQASRRVSKYNVTPADIMIQENSSDFDDVADAYMETYLAKVHSVTEAKNPGLYTAFLQTLMEAGEHPVNQTELHAKVKVLFKDYPDLLREFESLLDPTPSSTDEPSAVVRPTGHEESLSHMKFIQQLDKFTEKCPQLKAKIMNKLKTLKEFPNVGQKDIVTALEPFFITNPVMMEAFKAIFPSVYRPQSVSSSIDFEEIELDLEDPPRDNTDDLHFEVVKLPEETAVPATNTCPCCCHTDTNDPSFKSRSKHCRKCSLKFQDGKIYVHNGRVMRPVSVELTPVAPKTVPLPIGSGTSTTTTGRPCTALHHDRQKKEPHSHTQAHSSKSKEFKEPEVSSKNAERKSSHQLHHAHPQHHHPLQTQSSCSATKSSVTSKHTVVEESPAKEHRAKLEEATKATDGASESGESSKFHKPQQHHTSPAKPESKKQETGEWTEEEDTIILSTCQQEPSLNIAWRKMATLIPHRSLDLIKSRCSELIALIQTVNEER